MRTPTSLLVSLVTAAALLATAPAAGAVASAWSAPAGFPVAAGETAREAVPRAAIAADGTSAVAWMSKTQTLVVSAGRRGGRFSPPRVLDRAGASDWSVAAAPGGAYIVVWEDTDAVWAAVRTAPGRKLLVRRLVQGPASEINGVQVAADPLGGWVVARRVFPHGKRSERQYGIRTSSLDAEGSVIAPWQDLGPGDFGIDARPTQALAVAPDGHAMLTFRREALAFGAPQPVVVATRPHGGAFGTPVVIAADPVADPRIAIGEDGRVVIAATQVQSRGDAGAFGNPVVAGVTPAGALGAPFGPLLANPSRAFAPTVVPTSSGRSVLVFQLKTRAEAFATEAPVRAVAIAADGTIGRLQTLTSGRAKEPVAMGLSGGRALTIWSGRRGLDARLAGPDGIFKKSAPPRGPPPPPFHGNSTNRDLRTAGRYAIFTWERDGRVRVTVRRF